MDKREYLTALEKALKSAGVRDCADILEEYAEHFDMKAADGYGEEEIAAKLISPEEIAAQYKDIGSKGDADKAVGGAAQKIVTVIGVIFADIIAASIFIMLYAWVFTFGVFSITAALTGVVMASGLNYLIASVIIPEMPYICALLSGIALLALAVLSAIGTEYCRLYVTQILKVYSRWHKSTLCRGRHISPPLPVHPVIPPKKRRTMRSAALISLVVFVIALIAALISMIIASGSIQPWHVWQWFR